MDEVTAAPEGRRIVVWQELTASAWAVSQLRGTRFDFAVVAQLAERLPCKQDVRDSISRSGPKKGSHEYRRDVNDLVLRNVYRPDGILLN